METTETGMGTGGKRKFPTAAAAPAATAAGAAPGRAGAPAEHTGARAKRARESPIKCDGNDAGDIAARTPSAARAHDAKQDVIGICASNLLPSPPPPPPPPGVPDDVTVSECRKAVENARVKHLEMKYVNLASDFCRLHRDFERLRVRYAHRGRENILMKRWYKEYTTYMDKCIADLRSVTAQLFELHKRNAVQRNVILRIKRLHGDLQTRNTELEEETDVLKGEKQVLEEEVSLLKDAKARLEETNVRLEEEKQTIFKKGKTAVKRLVGEKRELLQYRDFFFNVRRIYGDKEKPLGECKQIENEAC